MPMPRFAANLTMMFGEHLFLNRFAAAAAAGFTAVEYLFPYEHPAEVIAEQLATSGLQQALFNMPPGNWAAGERGLAALAGRRDEFRASVKTALDYARVIGCPTLHLMSGIAEASSPAAWHLYGEAVAYAADELGAHGITLVIEPINTRDMPGYFLCNFDRAAALIAKLGHANLRLQFDIYHRQIIHGDVATGLRNFMPLIGHVQIASVPRRNEPMTGELDDLRILTLLDELGYQGFVGCEYRPAGETVQGLGWLRHFQ